MHEICRGFTEDIRHLTNQFKYVSTSAIDLTDTVRSNLEVQLGNYDINQQ